MMKRLLLLIVILIAGCANALADRGVVFTEQGLTAAEGFWDQRYYAVLEACSEEHEPRTPEAEACFGPTYDADQKVGAAVLAAVTTLRLYWAARAAGQNPDWGATAAAVAKILRDLPPDARQYFERIKGI